ncbi:MAG: hypothetical protein ACXVEF_43525 [Polyangiales bacterium]
MRLRASAFVFAMLLPAVAKADGSVVDSKVPTSDRPYFRAWTQMAFGAGLRFNNPYRLSKPLGDSAESLSTTAPYGTLGVGTWFGSPDGFQHGPILRYDRSLSGVTQHVLTPSYGVFRRGAWFGGWGRFGLPILLTPDPNVGGEIAFGGAFYVRSGIAITGEAIGDLFWGAATPENKRPIYPVLSGQLGVMLEWEQLP